MPRKSAVVAQAILLCLVLTAGVLAQTKISILVHGGRAQSPDEVWESIDRWIAEEAPDVEIEWLFDQRGKLDVMLAGGAGPDAWEVYLGPELFKYAKSGLATDLTPFLEKDTLVPRRDWLPVALDVWSYDGGVYALPTLVSHNGDMVYNRSLFAEIGLPDPGFDWTTADLSSAVRKLTRDLDGDGVTDIWGVGGFERLPTLAEFVWGAGGDLLTSDLQAHALGAPEARKVLEWIVDLVQRDVVDPVHDIWQSNFMKGKTGLHVGVGATWYGGFYSYAQKGLSIEEDLGRTLIPVDADTGQRQLMAGSDAYMINSASPHKELAWRAIRTLVRYRPEVMRMKHSQMTIPAIRAQNARVFQDLSFYGNSAANRDVLMEASKYIRPFVWPNIDLEGLFAREWSAVYKGSQPISTMIGHLDELVPVMAQK